MNRKEELDAKTERLLRLIQTESIGGVLLNLRHNFAWLTGGGRSGVDLGREPGAASLLVRGDGRRFVLASRIEMPRVLNEELDQAEFEAIEYAWEDEKSSSRFITDTALSLRSAGSVLGTDSATGDNLRSIESAIATCRYQLTASEIDRYTKLGADAGRIVGEIARTLIPGESESSIANRVSAALGSAGISTPVLLVAADDRITKYRHPVPKDRAWKERLMIVVCAERGGLIASLSRIVSAGIPSDELQAKTRAAANVFARLLHAGRPGVKGRDLYNVARNAYAELGFPGQEHLHHQGGACGYKTREWVAHPLSNDEVVDKQAFAWNPSITGTKVEDTVIIDDAKVMPLTKSPDWSEIIVSIDGIDYHSPDILVL